MKNLHNNKIKLSGTIASIPEFSHEVFGEKFYRFLLSSLRHSGTADEILCIVSEVELPKIKDNEKIEIIGQIRTQNVEIDGNRRVIISVFALELIPYSGVDDNFVEIVGFVCKEPVYRETPSGREITDLLISVERAYNKHDYIPTIAWGRTALRVAQLQVGTKLSIRGRMQSRVYMKKLEHVTEQRVAYELSAFTVYEEKEDA